jgi:hypothetical protein
VAMSPLFPLALYPGTLSAGEGRRSRVIAKSE